MLSVRHGDSQYVQLRFASAADLDRWQQSDEHDALVREADAQGPTGGCFDTQTGLETWFTSPDTARTHGPPPKWKMALTTWIGLCPIVVALGYALPSVGLPVLLEQAATTVMSVAMLTWVVMPMLTRRLYHWLYPQHASMSRRDPTAAGAVR